jgi:hypothetical protein
MKACEKNQKSIAWLALGALDGREETALREHLKGCAGCRQYFEEMSGVAKKVSAAGPDSSVQAPAFFHQRLTEKLRAAESRPILEEVMARLGRAMPGWRVVLPGAALILIAVFVVMNRRPASTVPVVAAPSVVVIATAPSSASDPAPTMGNYQMVAAQSLSKLDDLLTREGNRGLPPAPIYTGSTMRLSDAAF